MKISIESIRPFIENTLPFESSKNEYSLPFIRSGDFQTWKYSPAHIGQFRGALDFLVPLNTQVIAPLSGTIIEVVNHHDEYGPSEKFKNTLNYVTIQHANGEFSQVAHLAPQTVLLTPGGWVEQGTFIGRTGNSGWMTEPHLHFLVFKSLPPPKNFQGLRIKLEK